MPYIFALSYLSDNTYVIYTELNFLSKIFGIKFNEMFIVLLRSVCEMLDGLSAECLASCAKLQNA